MKPYNLLDEPWIPVLCRSGAVRWMAPWEITDTTDPPVRVQTPRPDFDCALTQFLIGLVQTAFTPADESEWRTRYKNPPAPKELKSAFQPFHDAFFLTGAPRLFMQDCQDPRDWKVFSINRLFIDGPGEKTMEENSDLFVKRSSIKSLGGPAAAAALITLQLNAPNGGQGHLTSLRGGGPLTTLLFSAECLWNTVWLNVLPKQVFGQLPGDQECATPGALFPWLAPPPSSMRPTEAQPAHHYWATSRRILLTFEDQKCRCDVHGLDFDTAVRSYRTKDHGIKYSDGWLHSLTPYTLSPDGKSAPLPCLANRAGFVFRDWVGIALGADKRTPAAIVRHYHSEQRRKTAPGTRLWASGYGMDNMKPVLFSSTITPLLSVELSLLPLLGAHLARLVGAAEAVCKTLSVQVRETLRPRGQAKLKGDLGFVSEEFWAATQQRFFDASEQVRSAVEEDRTESLWPPIAEDWLTALHSAAKRLFTAHSQELGAQESLDMQRLGDAWRELVNATCPSNRKLRRLLELPTTNGRKLDRASTKGVD